MQQSLSPEKNSHQTYPSVNTEGHLLQLFSELVNKSKENLKLLEVSFY